MNLLALACNAWGIGRAQGSGTLNQSARETASRGAQLRIGPERISTCAGLQEAPLLAVGRWCACQQWRSNCVHQSEYIPLKNTTQAYSQKSIALQPISRSFWARSYCNNDQEE